MITISEKILESEVRKGCSEMARLIQDITEMTEAGVSQENIKLVIKLRIERITSDIIMWVKTQSEN